MTHIRNSSPSHSPLPASPADGQLVTVEERLASWDHRPHDETGLTDEALDAALVQLLDQIRRSL